MTVRLDPADHPWMTADSLRPVLQALEAARPGGSRFVGGCVRNAILGDPVDDVDIATQLEPDAVTKALESAGLKAVPTGLEHGTITAVSGGEAFEVTTLRKDVSTDGRRAVVAFTEDWDEDSRRRDFRINAIYANFDGQVYDPQNGLKDAENREIVFIGDADDRIREDYLRILRFFRFFAWYGSGRPDRDGLLACSRHKAQMETLSAERIWAELKKLLAAPDPGFALRWMWTVSVLETLTGSKFGVDTASRLPALEQAQGWDIDPLLRFMALLPPRVERAETIVAKLKLSNAEKGRIMAWARLGHGLQRGEGLGDEISEADLNAALYRDGAQPFLDRAILAWADEPERDLGDFVSRLKSWERPEFPVSGKDLIAQGYEPGEALGKELKSLENKWIESGFSLDRAALLDQIQSA
ncbi:CCA tRNA nucleotidyltransferase [Euryhalocaulis caribicus]|uniref:CCA tRNA nucleotidyltransferase n=1 Tax=Euryhalocaulis caribicus TaxID=1161401 RepID=UPI0003A76376|nr:CCA tRNA nucleotidyltransferase [Euryhalocaulis caribicus]